MWLSLLILLLLNITSLTTKRITAIITNFPTRMGLEEVFLVAGLKGIATVMTGLKPTPMKDDNANYVGNLTIKPSISTTDLTFVFKKTRSLIVLLQQTRPASVIKCMLYLQHQQSKTMPGLLTQVQHIVFHKILVLYQRFNLRKKMLK